MDVDRAQNVASYCESVKLCHVAKIAAHHRHQQHPGGFHLALVVGIQAWLDDKWHSCVLLESRLPARADRTEEQNGFG